MPASHLTRTDYAAALALLARLEPLVHAPDFDQALVREVGAYVGSECTLLSVLRLRDEARGCGNAPAFADRRHVLRILLCVEGARVMSLMLVKGGDGFAERDRERLQLLQPHLAFLCDAAQVRVPAVDCAGPVRVRRPAGPQQLTPRQGEVIRWLAHGKTDAEIAGLLECSPRTVQKHLEHIYAKLGVETRTAAVMRALQIRPPDGAGGALVGLSESTSL